LLLLLRFLLNKHPEIKKKIKNGKTSQKALFDFTTVIKERRTTEKKLTRSILEPSRLENSYIRTHKKHVNEHANEEQMRLLQEHGPRLESVLKLCPCFLLLQRVRKAGLEART